jgi:hypothetical protein
VSERDLPSAEDPLVRRLLRVIAFVRDPALPGLLVMLAFVLAGFGAMAYGWYGAARTIYVPLQLPEVLSGGFGGLALVGVGLALFDLQTWRKHAARERALTDDVIDEVAVLVSMVPQLRARVRAARQTR